MSLQSKVLCILVSVITLVVTLDFVGMRSVVLPSFEAIEETRAIENVDAMLSILEGEREELVTIAELTAERTMLPDSDLRNWREQAKLDFLCHVEMPTDPEDGYVPVLFSECVDPETAEPLELHLFPPGGLHARSEMLTFLRFDRFRDSGWCEAELTNRGGSRDLLLAAHAIGQHVVFVGRFLGPDMRAAIVGGSVVEMQILPERPESMAGNERAYQAVTSDFEQTVVVLNDDDSLAAFRAIEKYGQVGFVGLILRADFPREVFQQARGTVNYLFLVIVGASLAMLLALYRALSVMVITPVMHLTKHAVRVGELGDTEARTGMERNDEIGQLAKEFDGMMDRLADSRAQVVHASRLAGRSEIATGVLHNVGNVLNSVNVSSAMVRKQLDDLVLADLAMIVEVLHSQENTLAEFVTSDPRGKHLVPFLDQLSGGLHDQRARMQTEVASLCEGVDHIAELVRSQQSYAITKGVFESSELSKEVESAVRMCDQAYGADHAVQIDRDFADGLMADADKHKLMEILVNLIHNANQAVRDNPEDERRVTLRTCVVDSRPRIEVVDNGVGIDSQNLTEVFHHGFTTKPDGHGFGLHVSANAATEMKCRLFAESEGPGHGATFILEFPQSVEDAPRLAA